MLYIANTFFELECSKKLSGPIEKMMSTHAISNMLQYLPIAFLPSHYGVMLSQKPSELYFEYLMSLGISRLPEMILFSEKDFKQWKQVESWGDSNLVKEWALKHKLQYLSPPHEIAAKVNSKVWNFSRIPALPNACLLYGVQDLKEALGKNVPLWVIKTDQGFSGNGHCIFSAAEEAKALAFCQREWKQGHPLLLEPWVNKLCEFSSQWVIFPEGHIQNLGVTKFFSTPSGRYLGTEIGSISDILFPFEKEVKEHLLIAEAHLKSIFKEGFWGKIGVDAMIYNEMKTGHVCLHPILEINARMTMSSALLQFHHLHRRKKVSRFILINNDKSLPGLLPPHFKKQLIIDL